MLSVESSNPVNLQNGKIPLTFARGDDRNTLYFVVGILKPIVAAEKHDINVLGASGGLFASSPEQLRQLVSSLQPKTLVLCPDAGSTANVHVMRRIRR